MKITYRYRSAISTLLVYIVSSDFLHSVWCIRKQPTTANISSEARRWRRFTSRKQTQCCHYERLSQKRLQQCTKVVWRNQPTC